MNSKHKFVKYKPSMITFYNQDHEMLLREPSLVAVSENDSVLAMGSEAERAAFGISDTVIGSPFKNGVVADFQFARQMLKSFIDRAYGRKMFAKPKVAVCVSVDMTQVESQAFSELIMSIGGKDVLIIEEAFSKAVQVIPDNYKIIIEITPE